MLTRQQKRRKLHRWCVVHKKYAHPRNINVDFFLFFSSLFSTPDIKHKRRDETRKGNVTSMRFFVCSFYWQHCVGRHFRLCIHCDVCHGTNCFCIIIKNTTKIYFALLYNKNIKYYLLLDLIYVHSFTIINFYCAYFTSRIKNQVELLETLNR